jgi:hypothetical protein
MLDLHQEVTHESRWFKEGLNELPSPTDIKNALLLRRRRLLSLFVQDLSSGVSGVILSNKSQRDTVAMLRLEKVAWRRKSASWLFVGLMNLGCCSMCTCSP